MSLIGAKKKSKDFRIGSLIWIRESEPCQLYTLKQPGTKPGREWARQWDWVFSDEIFMVLNKPTKDEYTDSVSVKLFAVKRNKIMFAFEDTMKNFHVVRL